MLVVLFLSCRSSCNYERKSDFSLLWRKLTHGERKILIWLLHTLTMRPLSRKGSGRMRACAGGVPHCAVAGTAWRGPYAGRLRVMSALGCMRSEDIRLRVRGRLFYVTWLAASNIGALQRGGTPPPRRRRRRGTRGCVPHSTPRRSSLKKYLKTCC